MIEQQCSHVWTWRPGWTRNICQKCGESEPLKELAAADPLRAELYDALRKRVGELEAARLHWTGEVARLTQNCSDDQARAEQAEAQLAEVKAEYAEAVADGENVRAELRRVSDKCMQFADQSETLRKRVAELEGLFSHVGVETHKWLDPECGHEGCQSLVLKARAEQAEAQLAEANKKIVTAFDTTRFHVAAMVEAEAKFNQACGREHDAKERCAELEKQCAELSGELEAAGIECAEAKARIAELEEANSEITVEALRDHRELHARAERAEAERDVITEWVIMIEDRLECAVQGDEICKGCVEVAYSCAKEARAALNPSLAARDHSQDGEG